MMNYTHKFMNLDNYFGENLFKIGEKLREKMKRKKKMEEGGQKLGLQFWNGRAKCTRDEKQGNDYFTITGLFLHGFSYYSPP